MGTVMYEEGQVKQLLELLDELEIKGFRNINIMTRAVNILNQGVKAEADEPVET